MINICVDCWNKIHGTAHEAKNVRTMWDDCPRCEKLGWIIIDRRFYSDYPAGRFHSWNEEVAWLRSL